jgi:hypothetical protein
MANAFPAPSGAVKALAATAPECKRAAGRSIPGTWHLPPGPCADGANRGWAPAHAARRSWRGGVSRYRAGMQARRRAIHPWPIPPGTCADGANRGWAPAHAARRSWRGGVSRYRAGMQARRMAILPWHLAHTPWPLCPRCKPWVGASPRRKALVLCPRCKPRVGASPRRKALVLCPRCKPWVGASPRRKALVLCPRRKPREYVAWFAPRYFGKIGANK